MRTVLFGKGGKTPGLPHARFLSTNQAAEEEDSLLKKFKRLLKKYEEDEDFSIFKHHIASLFWSFWFTAMVGPQIMAIFSEKVKAPKFGNADVMEYIFNVDGTSDDDKIVTQLTPWHHLIVVAFSSAGKAKYKYKYLLPFRNYNKIRLEGKLAKGYWIVYIYGDFQRYYDESESAKYMDVVFRELADPIDADQTSGET